MLLADRAVASGAKVNIQTQLFATDIDDRALETARAGVYPEAIVTDVTPARLRQYFVKEQNQLRLQKELRERILFARHNILRDPPFSRLDLISCRNLMIYRPRHPDRSAAHVPLRPQPRRLSVSRQLRNRRCSQPAVHAGRQEEPHLRARKEVGIPAPRPIGPVHGFALTTPPRPPFSASHTDATASSPSPTCTSARSSSTRRPASSSTKRRRSCTCPTAPGTSCAMSAASPH